MSRYFVEQRIYYPQGADPAIESHERTAPTLGVYYRGHGLYMVATDGGGTRQLTHTGTLLYKPEQHEARRWCRFDFDTACQMAEQHVDDLRMAGDISWAEYQEAHRG